MESTTSKVLTGCGIGCLLLIVVVAGVSFMGYRWVKDTTEAVEEAGLVERELEERFGPPRTFEPHVGDAVTADRIETFLEVREALAEPREELSETIIGLSEEGRGSGVTRGFRAARAGIGLAPRLLSYLGARNRSLLDAEMGSGEYMWFYWMTYYAWLGHPADDSMLHEAMTSRESGGGSVQIHFDEGMEPERLTWRLRRDVTAMLRNLESELAGADGREDLRELVAAELAELDENPARVPWEDGLPEALAGGLEPYRERLEATYSKATNPFELAELD
jgi:hypothetical protein